MPTVDEPQPRVDDDAEHLASVAERLRAQHPDATTRLDVDAMRRLRSDVCRRLGAAADWQALAVVFLRRRRPPDDLARTVAGIDEDELRTLIASVASRHSTTPLRQPCRGRCSTAPGVAGVAEDDAGRPYPCPDCQPVRYAAWAAHGVAVCPA